MTFGTGARLGTYQYLIRRSLRAKAFRSETSSPSVRNEAGSPLTARSPRRDGLAQGSELCDHHRLADPRERRRLGSEDVVERPPAGPLGIEGTRGGANGLSFGTPPPAVKTGMGLDDGEPQVGCTALRNETVKAVQQDLQSNPPQKFDVARRVRVFNAFMEFVDSG